MPRALVLIDMQMGMDSPLWGARNNPRAEANAARLLAHWREAAAPLVHIRHLSQRPLSPLHPSNRLTGFKPEVAPLSGETVFEKTTNSAFIGTPLQQHLHGLGVDAVTICGLSTPQCISTSVRMAANLGFAVTLAHDACAAFETHARSDWAEGIAPLSAEDIHISEISMLHGEFCEARATDTILGETP